MPNQTAESPADLPEPLVLVPEKAESDLSVDPQQIAQTMRELGISDERIASTTVALDPKPHLAVKGNQTPKALHRLRYGQQSINEGTGSLVRLSTVLRDKNRTPEQINQTLVHELEHVAQTERRDPKLFVGAAMIIGSAVLGAVIGNKVGKRTGNRLAQTGGTLVGARMGQAVAYKYAAPHEHQARVRAEQVSTKAISKK